MLRSMDLQSNRLIKDSHRRVNVVRVFWGYDAELKAEDMSGFEAWDVVFALKRVVAETEELVREFKDVVRLAKETE